MAKHLTDQNIADVCEVLDGWDTNHRLTWDCLVDAVKDSLSLSTTRQTLSKQVRIARAFAEVKGIVSNTTGSKKTAVKRKTPASLKIAQETIDRQNNTIKRLERENKELLEQFQVWLYNAYAAGVTPEQLNSSLPTPSAKKRG